LSQASIFVHHLAPIRICEVTKPNPCVRKGLKRKRVE
jgi:hypothetical protein